MSISRGLIAGAAGTVTLNVLTYLDMAVRGRPASSMPADTVTRVAGGVGIDVPSDDDAAQNRVQGLGALLGFASGLGFGALYGALRRRMDLSVPTGGMALMLGAMAGSNLPPVLMGVTDPGEWGAEGWIADIVPHAAYGLVAAGAYRLIADTQRST